MKIMSQNNGDVSVNNESADSLSTDFTTIPL